MASKRFSILIAPLVFTIFFHTSIGGFAQSLPSPPPSKLSSCTDNLVEFSRCLSYISLPPNNLSETVPSICCEAFSSAVDSGNGICICYLLRDPLILGFPLNFSRVLSLSSLCPLSDHNSATTSGFSLDLLCSGTETLPPLLVTSSGVDAPLSFGLSPWIRLAPGKNEENSSTIPILEISNSSSSIPSMSLLGSATTISQSNFMILLQHILSFLLFISIAA